MRNDFQSQQLAPSAPKDEFQLQKRARSALKVRDEFLLQKRVHRVEKVRYQFKYQKRANSALKVIRLLFTEMRRQRAKNER